MRLLRNILLYLALIGLFLPCICQAELGGNIASINAEQKAFNSQLSSIQNGETTVYTQTLPSGTIIYELVSSAGTVFAISWTGPSLPNLQAILGNFFKDYLDAIKDSRRSINVNNENIVIQSSGMMGAFQGLAFLPKQAPAGFSASKIPQ